MLTAPRRRPQEFGFNQGDHHLVANASTKACKAFNSSGVLLFTIPCLADGLSADWRANSGDTPPGLYRIGQVYRDYEQVGSSPGYARELMQFGWYSLDLIDLEGNEDGNGRAGLMVHGGGTACGWPGAWEPMQRLFNTLGCLRMHNGHLRDKIIPLVEQGAVYVSVYQDDN